MPILATPTFAAPPAPQADVFPPWQHGANNDATNRGFEFTVPQVDDLADFHGDITDPKLVLYVGGNYFFAMAPLVAEFEKEHPDYKGRIYWETIPPGLLVKQIEAGGTITSGNMTWTAKPDAYLAGLKKVDALIGQGAAHRPRGALRHQHAHDYGAERQPRARDRSRRSRKTRCPSRHAQPRIRGIARQIEASLKKAGGQALADAVYKTKVADGSTILTHIHHRQTPLFLMQGRADAGVTWQSEAMFQEKAGNPITHVDIPANQKHNRHIRRRRGEGRATQGRSEALAFLHPLPSGALDLRAYGFKPYTGKASTN